MKMTEDCVFEIEKEGQMRVPARIFANPALMEKMRTDRTIGQLKNVATLPGIVKYAAVMPDGHEGYGFPIGGVAAFDPQNGGVVSPGGVGYDINCGVRLLSTDLSVKDLSPKKKKLIEKIFTNVPSGVGVKGKLRLEEKELEQAVTQGVNWAIEKGFGRKEDIELCEENGCIADANWKNLSQRAKSRGRPQIGTVGAGNHFIELQEVQKILMPDVAKKFGLEQGKIVVMLHSGSRGFGHQICDDSIREMNEAGKKYKIQLPDQELCCAPIGSPEADKYLGAMRCGVNFAFCNRQLMMHWVREAFDETFGNGTSEDMNLIYDVCHNIAKFEEHNVDGKKMNVCVHRKGATRAFAAGRRELPSKYRDIGQPVIIPGSMGTASYVLVGTQGAMDKTFGSTCHGAGRNMSRHAAKSMWTGEQVAKNLADKNILVRATELGLVSEEAPGAYKDVDAVVSSVESAGLSKAVARMIPLAVVKG
ncbi:MAG: RtcB family protein [Candidatus Micrarchaeia archaeon]